ncbi:hypothetical protein KY385_03290 [Candidatus Parcubacteria bacterium]|nr:hypothetical protein [Candidatus Parcubacteria bacterium]
MENTSGNGKNHRLRTLLLVAGGLVVLALVAVAVYALTYKEKEAAQTSTADSSCTDMANTADVRITYTANREFQPSCLRVKPGTVITYQNESARKLEVGANPHPLHSSNKEVSGGAYVLEVEPGGSKQVTVNETGTNGYHDHLFSDATGTIVVDSPTL